MNKLPLETRVQILSLLCEGASMRTIARVADVSFNTVKKLLIDAGRACATFHDERVRDVKAKRVQVDEIWSFTYAKQKNVATAKKAPAIAGDTWTWTAIEAQSKLILTWLVGGRDGEYALKRPSTNTSGFKGVSFHNGKWRARIASANKAIFLGHFSTKEKAYAAYVEAAAKLHGEFARVA